MRYTGNNKKNVIIVFRYIIVSLFSFLLLSCAELNPHTIDVEIPLKIPETKVTVFDNALSDIGLMTLIYGSDILQIMPYGGRDNTGLSEYTRGEIPKEILEMIVSAINSIGGNIYYIPYNPEFHNGIMQQLGTTDIYAGKRVPHVVLTGGITEFDRGLNTRGKNTDASVETKPFTNAPKWSPGDVIGMEYTRAAKNSTANITLDFNLLDFYGNVGIQNMQTTNSIVVHKGAAEQELAISLFGPSFGWKGSIKKVEGRHAAVRLLVQLSLVQIMGKFFDLPYWKLLPEGKTDAKVIKVIQDDFLKMDLFTKAVKTQEWLFMNGYNIAITGAFDEQTIAALKHFDDTFVPTENGIGAATYVKLYCSVPVTDQSLQRRYAYVQILEAFIASLTPPPAPEPEPEPVLTEETEKRKEAAKPKKCKVKKKKKRRKKRSARAKKNEKDSVGELLKLLQEKKSKKISHSPQKTKTSARPEEW